MNQNCEPPCARGSRERRILRGRCLAAVPAARRPARSRSHTRWSRDRARCRRIVFSPCGSSGGTATDIGELQAPTANSNTISPAASAEEVPLDRRAGGFIARGVDAELDEARDLRDESRKIVASLQARYVELTGTRQLKIKHNNFLGFFLEVPQTHGERLLRAAFRRNVSASPDHGRRHAVFDPRTRGARNENRVGRRPCARRANLLCSKNFRTRFSRRPKPSNDLRGGLRAPRRRRCSCGTCNQEQLDAAACRRVARF